ncbi:MAG: hypothetical protein OET90_05055, partial [Desulfuromonadales bacterium]|nr:hypothetical protein [Desulfuromonadales bacterium]
MPHPSRFHQTAKKVLCTTALIVVAGMGLFYVNQRVNPFGISDHMDSYSQDLFNMVVGHLPSGTREALYPTTG